jgi:hypothetical protein
VYIYFSLPIYTYNKNTYHELHVEGRLEALGERLIGGGRRGARGHTRGEGRGLLSDTEGWIERSMVGSRGEDS